MQDLNKQQKHPQGKHKAQRLSESAVLMQKFQIGAQYAHGAEGFNGFIHARPRPSDKAVPMSMIQTAMELPQSMSAILHAPDS